MEPVAQERGRSAQSTRTKAGHPRWSRAHGEPCPSGQDCGFTPVSHALASLFPNPFRCAAAVWRRQSCKDALPRSTGDLLCMFPGSSGKGPTEFSARCSRARSFQGNACSPRGVSLLCPSLSTVCITYTYTRAVGNLPKTFWFK